MKADVHFVSLFYTECTYTTFSLFPLNFTSREKGFVMIPYFIVFIENTLKETYYNIHDIFIWDHIRLSVLLKCVRMISCNIKPHIE